MNRISFEGFNNKYATFDASSTVSTGKPVKLDDSGKCVRTTDGDMFIGICASLRNGTAGIQLQGYAELDFEGDVPPYGYAKIVCSASGGIRVADVSEDGLPVKVVKVDEDTCKAGFIF